MNNVVSITPEELRRTRLKHGGGIIPPPLEHRVTMLEIDNDLLWETQWGHTRNLQTLFGILLEKINEVWSQLWHQEKEDHTFKNNLSATHKKYYEKFEFLFKQMKTNASTRRVKYNIYIP